MTDGSIAPGDTTYDAIWVKLWQPRRGCATGLHNIGEDVYILAVAFPVASVFSSIYSVCTRTLESKNDGVRGEWGPFVVCHDVNIMKPPLASRRPGHTPSSAGSIAQSPPHMNPKFSHLPKARDKSVLLAPMPTA